MKNNNFKYGIILLYIILFVFFYHYSIQIKIVNNIFLTISTFLFTIFTGFFISRQGSRYTKIREIVANFDGEMSALHRYAGYFSKDFSNKIGSIIKRHYQTILDHNAWDYHFINKSETITNIHEVMQSSLKDQNLPSLTNQAVTNIFRSLGNLQMLRKQMIMLHQEHIPKFEMGFIYFLTCILLINVSIIPSSGVILDSILKASFIVSLIAVVIILKSLDNLKFFEGTIGSSSANDVIEIINGNK